MKVKSTKAMLTSLLKYDRNIFIGEKLFITKNTCIYEIEINENERKILLHGCTAHLEN